MSTDVTFTLEDHARIWIYQADRVLNSEEISKIEETMKHFIQSWSAHGAALTAESAVVNSQFVLLAVDEEKALASGCSIDKSVHLMKALGQELGIDFFDRMQTAFIQNGEVKVVGLHQFWAMRKAGLVNEETLVFDNLVKTVGEFRKRWQVPFGQSWHAEMWK